MPCAQSGACLPLKVLLTLALPVLTCQADPHKQIETATGMVSISRFVPATLRGTQKLWSLSFHYSFPYTKPILLDGVGQIAPKGELTYLTDKKELRFLGPEGQHLRTITLSQLGDPEGAGIEIPAEGDFAQPFQTFVRKRNFLPNECDVLLNEFFTSGYTIRAQDKITFYTTAYQPLKDGVSANKRARVSLQISCPYQAQMQQVAFRVQMLVRERGRGEEKDTDTVTFQTQQAAVRFRDRVIAKLQEIK